MQGARDAHITLILGAIFSKSIISAYTVILVGIILSDLITKYTLRKWRSLMSSTVTQKTVLFKSWFYK